MENSDLVTTMWILLGLLFLIIGIINIIFVVFRFRDSKNRIELTLGMTFCLACVYFALTSVLFFPYVSLSTVTIKILKEVLLLKALLLIPSVWLSVIGIQLLVFPNQGWKYIRVSSVYKVYGSLFAYSGILTIIFQIVELFANLHQDIRGGVVLFICGIAFVVVGISSIFRH